MLMTKSGCVFEISFRLLATLFCTYVDVSVLSCSNIGSTDVGSFLNLDIACPQGNWGRQPSLASLRTCSLLCLDHLRICAIIRSSSLMIKALTANSEDQYSVFLSNALIDKSQFMSSCP